jgi:transcriptional regulator with XRE-family HTH domain
MRPVQMPPSDDRVRLGSRLRASRQDQGLTIAQVAEATGLTKGFISRIERDETSPSVATLLQLCQVLSLPVGSLFEAPAAEVVRAESAPFINMGGQGAIERLMTPRSQSRLQLMRSTMEVGAEGGKELYTVNCETEVILVLTGRVEVIFANESVALGPGDALTFPGSEPHSWRNADEEEADVIWVLIPAAWSGSA